MPNKIQEIKMENEFRICPICGYKDGFHSMFEKIQNKDEISWKLICPECHNIFDINLQARIK